MSFEVVYSKLYRLLCVLLTLMHTNVTDSYTLLCGAQFLVLLNVGLQSKSEIMIKLMNVFLVQFNEDSVSSFVIISQC